MKNTILILAAFFAIHTAIADSKKPSDIAWNPEECSKPLMLPEHSMVSKYGRGKYRIDGMLSEGHFNCIYIIFQASGALEPASVADAGTSTFKIKSQEISWRIYKTIVEGHSVIRKEALVPNILPHQKQGNDSDFIWLRIDGKSQEALDQITPIAENILKDAA